MTLAFASVVNRYQMISSIIALCVFRAVWISFVFPLFKTPEAVYIAYPLSWILVVVIDGVKIIPTLIRYKNGKKLRCLILENQPIAVFNY